MPSSLGNERNRMVQLSEKFAQALTYALSLHAGQVRKGTQVPYAAHLLAVSALVLEDGGSEAEAIAGLLHDAVEDRGGLDTLHAIEQRFGAEVAAIVMGCSDSVEIPKPPWKPRKQAYIEHLLQAPDSVCRVSLADKLHNARALYRDLRLLGDQLWPRFAGAKDGTLWYYARLVQVFQRRSASFLVSDLADTVDRIERLARTASAPA